MIPHLAVFDLDGTLVTRDTREQDFAHHRQLFLTEQGYSYQISDGAELAGESRGAALTR